MTILLFFLAGALVATMLIWYPLHKRYKTNKLYEQFLDDVDYIKEQRLSYYDTELRSRQLMRTIMSHHKMFIGKSRHNLKDTRELIPWILDCGESCWEMRELLNYLNHIGLDIELRSKLDNSIMNMYSEKDLERYKNRYGVPSQQERY